MCNKQFRCRHGNVVAGDLKTRAAPSPMCISLELVSASGRIGMDVMVALFQRLIDG